MTWKDHFGRATPLLLAAALACGQDRGTPGDTVASASTVGSTNAGTGGMAVTGAGGTGGDGGAGGQLLPTASINSAASNSASSSSASSSSASSSSGGMMGGLMLGWQATEFSVMDVNPNSARFGQAVSPKDYLKQVSGWYFGHST